MKRLLIVSSVVAVMALAGGCNRASMEPAQGVTSSNADINQGTTSDKGSTLGGGASNSGTQMTERAGSIRWVESMDAALKESKRTRKPIMVDFYATWCGPCKMLDEEVYADKAVIERAQQWISLKVDVDKDVATASKYQVQSLPTVGFLRSDGSVITGFTGVPTVSHMIKTMDSSLAEAR